MVSLSSRDTEFLSTLQQWIAQQGEVLVMFRYSRAAGSKDFEFFDSVELLNSRLQNLPLSTSIIVFRESQLPLRGTVDDEFIKTALLKIPNGVEFLVVNLTPEVYGKRSWHGHRAGTTHEELQSELKDEYGQKVAVGLYPPWLEDNESVISAIVPDETGQVTAGIY
jgi:hypothetical protein